MLCEVVADGMVVEMPVVIGVVVESAFTRSQVMVGEVTPDAEQENCKPVIPAPASKSWGWSVMVGAAQDIDIIMINHTECWTPWGHCISCLTNAY